MSEIDDAAVDVSLTAFFKAGGGLPGMRAALTAYQELCAIRAEAEIDRAWSAQPPVLLTGDACCTGGGPFNDWQSEPLDAVTSKRFQDFVNFVWRELDDIRADLNERCPKGDGR